MSTALTGFLGSIRPAFEADDVAATDKLAEIDCVSRVEALYRAIAVGDLTAFAEGLADDIELENIGPPAVPFIGQWRGRAAVLEAVVRNFSHLEEQSPEVLSVVAQGEMVVVTAMERGRYRATGRTYHMHWVQHFTFRGGRLAKFRQVIDATGLLPAIGAEG